MKEVVVRLGRWCVQRTIGRDLSGSYHAAIRDDGERATLYRPAGELAAMRGELPRLIALHRDLAHAGVVGFRAIDHDGDELLLVGDPVDDAMASLLRGRRPDPGQTRRVGAALAAALVALHDRGVAHGDLELDTALWAPGEPPRLLGAGVAGLLAGDLSRPDGDVVGLGRLLCALVASWPRRGTGGAWSTDELRTVELARMIADPGAGLSMRKALALLAGDEPLRVAGGLAPELPVEPPVEAVTAPVGAQLGRYRILGRLGSGGMGEVVLAEDPTLRRGVAIKRIRPALQRDRTFRARLRREAQLAAHLSHRAIAQVFDLICEDDVDHLIMEYVPGPSLHALLAGRPMPVAEALRIAAELADGLAYAHQHGIVHRDLKLENVLIRTDGQPKIVDFGIACRTAIAGDSAVHEALTRDGFMVGTSRAMSPEQIQCREVDARSDLFSFGVLLYELVTGTTPFAAAAEPLIMLRVLNDRQAPARDALPEVPPALSELIDHLLEKDPALRPETARSVRDRLRRMLDAPQPVPHVAPHLAPHLAPHGAAGLDPLPPRRRLGSEPPPTSALRVERHQVALACIDLYAAGAGGDELAGREMIADALPAFRARIDEIVMRSDGVLVSALGHRFIACFGHTRPVERAARRALLAGRAMLAAAAELRCPEPVPPGARFSATGAIHTGFAVVRTGGAGDELLLGATLDTALRLLQIGGSGDLWLSEPAARAVEPEFQLERPAALPAGVPAARRLIDAPIAAAAGSGEHGLSIAQRDREPPPAPAAVRRAPDAADSAPRPTPFGELGIASQPIRRPLSSRIQAPFVLAEIRALRSSIFKHSPECRSALAIADKVETSYDLRRNDLFIPAGDTWCAILEPFAMTVLTGTLRRIGYEIFPQYVSILGIATPDVRTAMELRSPIDLIRVICAAYSKCVIGTDAGTLTATVEGSRAIVADTTIIPCHLQIGVFLGAGKLTGLFGDGALCEKRCRSRGDAACTYEFAL